MTRSSGLSSAPTQVSTRRGHGLGQVLEGGQHSPPAHGGRSARSEWERRVSRRQLNSRPKEDGQQAGGEHANSERLPK